MSPKSKNSMRVTLIVLASCAAASVPAKSASPLNFTQILSFAGANGANPIAPLTADAKGVLYGSTSKGGQTGSGVIFKLTPPAAGQTQWTYELLHDFGDYADGSRSYEEVDSGQRSCRVKSLNTDSGGKHASCSPPC